MGQLQLTRSSSLDRPACLRPSDRNLRLQYLAGMSLNTYQADPIYINMTKHSQYPENLFIGSPATLDALRKAIHFPSR